MFVRLARTNATSFLLNNSINMGEINLNEFLEWYKKVDITLGDKTRVFREPAIKDIGLNVLEILKKYCLEGNPEEFLQILEHDIPTSKYKELIEKILNGLGLV